MQQAVVWNQNIDKLRALGYEVATVTKDSVDKLKAFSARRKIGITLLSDVESEIITGFGVRDDQYGTGGLYGGIARPSVFVVDANGTIRYSQDVNHYAPPPIDAVIAAIKGG